MKWTNQTAFDAVCKHLRNQNGRAKGPRMHDTCLYRMPDGRKCAVGALIPDDLAFDNYSNSLSLQALMDRVPAVKELFEEVSKPLLIELQRVHDDPRNWTPCALGYFTKDGDMVLGRLANDFGLTNLQEEKR